MSHKGKERLSRSGQWVANLQLHGPQSLQLLDEKKKLKEKKSSHRLDLRPISHGPPTLLASDMTVCIKFNFTGQLGKPRR